MDIQASDPGEPTERGASAVEYGLLAVGIAALVVAAVYVFGGNVLFMFDDSCSRIATEQHTTC